MHVVIRMGDDELSVEFSRRCHEDFAFFVENVLGYKLAGFHREQIDLMLRHRYVCIINPVSHGKTTVFAIAYPIWLLWKMKDYDICLVSSTEEQAMRALGIIQRTIEDSEFLKHLVPSAKTVKWGSTFLITTNGNRCYTKPFSDSARGIQPDLIVYDDLLRGRDISMEQIKEVFWTVFIPRGQARGSKHIVVGTPQDDDDLLTEIEKSHSDQWVTIRKSAVITDDLGKWLKPLWPEVFSLSDLKNLKDAMGLYRFNREYMCQPSGTEGGLFPPEMIADCCFEDIGFSNNIDGVAHIGADFAMSKSATGDYTVFAVVDHITGVRKFGEREVKDPIIVKHMERKKGGDRKWHIERIKWLNDTYHPNTIVADSSTFGQVFIDDLKDDGVFVFPQAFESQARNKLLLGLRRVVEDGRLIIPIKEDSLFTYNVTKELINELRGFEERKTKSSMKTFQSSKKHDDMVMALSMAISRIRDKKPMPMHLIHSA
jgi:hypothetical protein